jgi:hypothetical protein
MGCHPFQNTTTDVWMRRSRGCPAIGDDVDDVIFFDKDEAQHTGYVRQFLARCKEKRITLDLDTVDPR